MQFPKNIFVIAAAALILAGCSNQVTVPEVTPTPADDATGSPSNNQSDVLFDQSGSEATGDGAQMRSITLSEVAQHANPPTDCWLVINNVVYNVSNFAENGHPGGTAIYQGCGKDATSLFETRPMGSNTPHSEKARSFLPNFEIGVLVQE